MNGENRMTKNESAQEIKDALLKLIRASQEHANCLMAEMPKPKENGRGTAWEEYSKFRALSNSLQECYEKLT